MEAVRKEVRLLSNPFPYLTIVVQFSPFYRELLSFQRHLAPGHPGVPPSFTPPVAPDGNGTKRNSVLAAGRKEVTMPVGRDVGSGSSTASEGGRQGKKLPGAPVQDGKREIPSKQNRKNS